MYLPGASRSKCQTWWSKYKFIGSSSRSVPALNCKTARILTCSGPCSSARHQAAQMSPHWCVDSAAGPCSCQTSPRRKIIHYWIKHVQDVNMFECESSRRISYFPWAHELKLSFGMFWVFFSMCFAAFQKQSECFGVWFEIFPGVADDWLTRTASFFPYMLASCLPSSPHLLCLFTIYILPTSLVTALACYCAW